jgi:hypothetical protein
MTRRNSLQTIHEPFGDAYYYGPERMGARFENDEEAREKSGFADSKYKTIIDRIDREAAEVCLESSLSLLDCRIALSLPAPSSMRCRPLRWSHTRPATQFLDV